MSNCFKADSLKSIELRAKELLCKRHNSTQNQLYRRYTNEIIFDKKTHLSSKYKEMIITEEPQSMFRRYYSRAETNKRLQKLCYFFSRNMLLSPNLCKTEENRYLLINIYCKQNIIENEQVKTKNKYSVQNKRKSFLFGFGLYHNEEINKSQGDEIFNNDVREELDELDWRVNFKTKDKILKIPKIESNYILNKIEKKIEINNKIQVKKEIIRYNSIENLIDIIETAEKRLGICNQEKLVNKLPKKSVSQNLKIENFKKSNFKNEYEETYYKSNKTTPNNLFNQKIITEYLGVQNQIYSENFYKEHVDYDTNEKDLIIDEDYLFFHNKNSINSYSNNEAIEENLENKFLVQSRRNSKLLKEAHNIRRKSSRKNLTEISQNQVTSKFAQQVEPILNINDAFPLGFKFKKTEEFIKIKNEKKFNELLKDNILKETLLRFKEDQYKTLVMINKSNIIKKNYFKESGLVQLENNDKEKKYSLCENNYPSLLKNNSSNNCSMNNYTSIYQTLTTQNQSAINLKTNKSCEKENLNTILKNKVTMINLQPIKEIKNQKSRNKGRKIKNAVFIRNKEVSKEFYTNNFSNTTKSNYLNTNAYFKNYNIQHITPLKTSEINTIRSRETEFNEYSTMSKSQTENNSKMKFNLGVNNKKLKIYKGSDKNTLPVKKIFFPLIK
jgi:hypothetical protein